MKSGMLSQAVAQAALAAAEQELRALNRSEPAKAEKETGSLIRMLPRAAAVLRERIGAGNMGLRDPLNCPRPQCPICDVWGQDPDAPMRHAAG